MHFLRKSRYLNEAGEDLMAEQGWVSGYPSHVLTMCGQTVVSDKQKYNQRSTVATNRWERVTCAECMKHRKVRTQQYGGANGRTT